jgi:hydroxymethylbilane synthase
MWVHGCADGLGDTEAPALEAIVGRPIRWLRLTHAAAAGADMLATYEVESALPGDLPNRTHFFWTSGTEFRRAIARFPGIALGHHASGPGRTARAIRETLGPAAHAGVWLDYDSWYQDICR